MTPKVDTREMGIATATIRVGRVRRRKTNTVRVASSAPKTSAKIVSSTDSRIALEKSAAPSFSTKVMPGGRVGSMASMRR
jgi:hypothetical protein